MATVSKTPDYQGNFKKIRNNEVAKEDGI